MGKIQFTEDPFAWIGVRTWPFVMTQRLARIHGIFVATGLLTLFLILTETSA